VELKPLGCPGEPGIDEISRGSVSSVGHYANVPGAGAHTIRPALRT
jgi:hypothetical protein